MMIILEKIPIESTMLSAIAYHADTQTLYAEFERSGKIWSYTGVSKEQFEQLLDASSKGTFMKRHIIGYFEENRVRKGKDFKW